MSPAHGTVTGGTSVTVSGLHFLTAGSVTVDFGGDAATNVVVVDDATITCDTPAGSAGAVDVDVTNNDGTGTLTNGFTYHNAPALSQVDPAHGVLAGGTNVTLTGTDFTTVGTTDVTFGGVSATNITVVSDTAITCNTPAKASAGAVDVTITNDFGSDTPHGRIHVP